MASESPDLDPDQRKQLDRFRRMGLSTRPMADGRSLLVALPLGPAPLATLGEPLRVKSVLFATVGAHEIKCLRPRPFFGLPLLDIHRCIDAAELEMTIRQAWRKRVGELEESATALEGLGLRTRSDRDESVLSFALPGEMPSAQVRMHRLDQAILPSCGPLTELPLQEFEERVLDLGAPASSGADLECRIGSRIDELRRRALARQDVARSRGALVDPGRIEIPEPETPDRASRASKVLLVGPTLLEDAKLRAELERQGYQIVSSRSESEALSRMAGMSPDLVLSEFSLARSDGASLVLAMHSLPGIERIPVLLLDDAHHTSRREAARAVGAAGYVVSPASIERFVTRLGQLVEKPGERRFTRYPQRLVTEVEGITRPCLATEVGRGGVFISTEELSVTQSALHCEISLPDLGRALRFEGEILYRAESQGTKRQGIGVRFFDISEEDEASLIEYLRRIESRR